MPEALPKWNLDEQFGYKGLDDPNILKDSDAAVAAAEAFATKYKGKLASLSGDALAGAIQESDQFYTQTANPPLFYAHLHTHTEQQNPAIGQLMGHCGPRMGAIESTLAFVESELAEMNAGILKQKYAESTALLHYLPLIDNIRRKKEHLLSPEQQAQLPHTKEEQDTRLRDFVQEQNALQYTINKKELDLDGLKEALSSHSEETRRAASEARLTTLQSRPDFLEHAADTLNEIITDKNKEDELRKYKHPLAARNTENHIENAVVDTMLTTVKASYPLIAHRYNALKAQMYGMEKLEGHNESAPPPATKPTYIPWEEAKEIVLKAYSEFSPTMAKYAQRMFDEGYIDAEPRKGKQSISIGYQPYTKDHPVLLMNYHGRPQDVVDLGHELGHSIHQWLAYETQGYSMQETPVTLAETASSMGEKLVLNKMLERIKSPTERKALLMRKIEEGISTIERNVQITEFERDVHEQTKKGEKLTSKQLDGIWLAKLQERQGENFTPSPGQEHDWALNFHIFDRPFYSYSYPLGGLLVESLDAAKQAGNVPDFENKYLDILKAAGTKHHKELLAPMNIDMSKSDFWQKGMQIRIHDIEQLETILKQEKAALDALDSNVTVKKGRKNGDYTIAVTKAVDKQQPNYEARASKIAQSLAEALGVETSVSRGAIKLTSTDGVVAERLAQMASKKTEATLQ